jgi:twitching motility two-component system response regulator PilH
LSRRILVVDDTLSLVDLIRDLLSVQGYDVSTCLMAREAYPLARRLRPDLVILDIVMPEVSGWDVLDRVRKDPLLERIPIVICTAWAEQAAARMREMREPDLWLLPKPFDADELLDTVKEALELARAIDERR